MQKNERIKRVGKFKHKKGRNLPKGEGRDKWGSLGASEESGMLQKNRRIWKNTLRGSENQVKGEEGSPEKVGMKKEEEEWQGEFQRKLKEFDGMEWSRRNGLDL